MSTLVDDGQLVTVTRTVRVTPEQPGDGGLRINRVDNAGASDTATGWPHRYTVTAVDPAGAGDTATATIPVRMAFVDAAGATDTVSGLPVMLHVVDDAGAGDTYRLGGTVALPGVDAPPGRILLTAAGPATITGTTELVAPADGAVIPAARPLFTVAVTTDADGAYLQVEYTGADGRPALVQTPVFGGLSGVPVTVTTAYDLPDDTVFTWRARLTDTAGATDWTAPWSFATSLGDGYAVAGGSYTVTPGLGAPAHVWHADPGSGADTGETAALVGTGLGPVPHVSYGPVGAAVTAYSTFAAGPDGYGPDRTITPGAVPSCYHERVEFTVPDLDPDDVGALVTVYAQEA